MYKDHRTSAAVMITWMLAPTWLGCDQDDAAQLREPAPVEVTGNSSVRQPEVVETPAELRRRSESAGLSPLPERASAAPKGVDKAQVALGQRLYFETRLSSHRGRSCNSCHDLESYGVDPDSGSHPEHTSRNAPTVYNTVLHAAQFWDGRVRGEVEQVKVHLLEKSAMGLSDAALAVRALTSSRSYVALFKRAFPGDAEPITFEHVAEAIAAFEQQLLTPARFDAFLAGDMQALNEQERRGLALFLDAGCTACHRGPALGGRMFHKLGVLKAYETEDPGRAELTGKERDEHVFKVPGLRNVAMTGPYLHDGSVSDLADAVQLMVEHQTPKGRLTDEETGDLVAFLHTLTGELPMRYVAPPSR